MIDNALFIQDVLLVNCLATFAAAAKKMCMDIRVLQVRERRRERERGMNCVCRQWVNYGSHSRRVRSVLLLCHTRRIQ